MRVGVILIHHDNTENMQACLVVAQTQANISLLFPAWCYCVAPQFDLTFPPAGPEEEGQIKWL